MRPLPLTKRFVKAFGQGIWGEVIDRRVEILVAVVGIAFIAIQIGFSPRKLIAGKWEAGAVVIDAICVLVIWHSFRSAYSVSGDLKNEPTTAVSQIDSPYGGKVIVDIPRHSWPRLKLYGIAVCLSTLSFTDLTPSSCTS